MTQSSLCLPHFTPIFIPAELNNFNAEITDKVTLWKVYDIHVFSIKTVVMFFRIMIIHVKFVMYLFFCLLFSIFKNLIVHIEFIMLRNRFIKYN